MDDQQVPNLEQMDEQRAKSFLEEMFTTLSAAKEHALRHEDYAMEMPQSGERIRGPENMRAFQQAFATNSTPAQYPDTAGTGEGGTAGGGGGQRLREGKGVQRRAHSKLKDGKWWHDTRYDAEPFEAPEWRARWVERMEA